MSYWDPVNAGFNPSNSKFVCEACHQDSAFALVSACGKADSWVLAKGMGLPGIFCSACGDGQIGWRCPKCDADNRLFKAFQYDSSQITLKKKPGFFGRLFGK